MNSPVLFIVQSDPRQSARPAEAIRIAAGLGTWRKIEVGLYLHGAAVLTLSECVDDFVDSDNYTRYWPILAGLGHPIYVEKHVPLPANIAEPVVRVQTLTREELARLAAQAGCVTRF
mgnify:FL=1